MEPFTAAKVHGGDAGFLPPPIRGEIANHPSGYRFAYPKVYPALSFA